MKLSGSALLVVAAFLLIRVVAGQDDEGGEAPLERVDTPELKDQSKSGSHESSSKAEDIEAKIIAMEEAGVKTGMDLKARLAKIYADDAHGLCQGLGSGQPIQEFLKRELDIALTELSHQAAVIKD